MADQDTTTKAFVGLPIEDLIVAPIIGAAKGQRQLAQVTLDFVEELAFKPSEGGDDSSREANIINVKLDRLVNSGTTGEVSSVEQQVQMPVLPLVTVPNFAMDTMAIHFDMEVGQHTSDTSSSDSSTTTDKGAKVSGGWSGFGAHVSAEAHYNVTGTVSSHKDNTRSTDFSAKYSVDATAKQLPPAEGMARFTQILASVIEPINTKQSKES
tara:strand:+ start:321 stop:953 length:633 start_codon:yes stop_codon:yes gene_type:complete